MWQWWLRHCLKTGRNETKIIDSPTHFGYYCTYYALNTSQPNIFTIQLCINIQLMRPHRTILQCSEGWGMDGIGLHQEINKFKNIRLSNEAHAKYKNRWHLGDQQTWLVDGIIRTQTRRTWSKTWYTQSAIDTGSILRHTAGFVRCIGGMNWLYSNAIGVGLPQVKVGSQSFYEFGVAFAVQR